MHKNSFIHLNCLLDKIDFPSPEQKNGYKWGSQYVDILIKQIVMLKQQAKIDNNPYLYNQLQTSLIKAHEVKSELNHQLQKI